MSYDEEQARRSRVVVDTPGERREVVHTQTVRGEDRSGISAGMVGVLVVVAIALITMLVLFWMSSQPTNDPTLTAAQPPTTVVEQPAPVQQPPVIIQQQPAPVTTQPAPVIVTPPAGGTVSESSQALNMDSKIQTEIDKHLTEDSTFSTLGITATVIDGKVLLTGTVKSETLKADVERMVRQIKGVKAIDNQITVM